MQWDEFVCNMPNDQRTRLMQLLEEGRCYASITSGRIGSAEVEQIVAALDHALDALAAARLLLQAPVEPRPWKDPAFRAYRTSHPTSSINVPPRELERVLAAVRDRDAQAPSTQRTAAAVAGPGPLPAAGRAVRRPRLAAARAG
jgi:hypothetical protein